MAIRTALPLRHSVPVGANDPARRSREQRDSRKAQKTRTKGSSICILPPVTWPLALGDKAGENNMEGEEDFACQAGGRWDI